MDNPRRKANIKYHKKTKSVCITFTPQEMELYDFVKNQENKNGFLKGLIRERMKNE